MNKPMKPATNPAAQPSMQLRGKTLQLLTRYTDEPGRQSIDMDSELDALELDSLAMFEIVYELEESFAVELDELALAEMKTVGDLVAHIERELAEKD